MSMTIDRRHRLRFVAVLGLFVLVAVPGRVGWAQAEDSRDRVRRAVAYLDARQDAWSRFEGSSRGEAEDRTTCVSCHTGVSYALSRPVISLFLGEPAVSSLEEKRIADVTKRVERWGDLDSPRYRLMYDFDDRKRVESWGTEAVLDTLILAKGDRFRSRTEPSSATRSSLARLWETQETQGDDAGSWAWLNFGLEPWEGGGSRAFGAALGAIAVGSVPGYLDASIDEPGSKGVGLLRDYLNRRFPRESLHNQIWILEAASWFKGIVTPEERRRTLDQLRAAQGSDGGWSLAALGNFRRVDGSEQTRTSDGYATGLAVHALIAAGEPSTRPEVTRAVGWLRSQQNLDGSWPGISVNKQRDPASFAGKLMTDAATAYSARALIEAETR
jgi:squalene-hopene/tetraprenyl-beta-curcumene cyclase